MNCTIPAGYDSTPNEGVKFIQLNKSENKSERLKRAEECTIELKVAFHDEMDELQMLADSLNVTEASWQKKDQT